jgi:hypothetical protein
MPKRRAEGYSDEELWYGLLVDYLEKMMSDLSIEITTLANDYGVSEIVIEDQVKREILDTWLVE